MFKIMGILHMYIKVVLIFLVALITGCSTSSIKKEYNFDHEGKEGLGP